MFFLGSDDNYDFSYQSGVLTIVKADQTIQFDPISEKKTTDVTFELTATSSSGLPLSYSSSNALVVTVTGSTARVIGAGVAEITATQSGDDRYKAATASQSVTVKLVNDTRIRSRVDINPIDDLSLGVDPIALTASIFPDTAKVIWEILAGAATIDGDVLSIGQTAGLVRVKASILATGAYKASEDIIEFAVVDPVLITPTITFELPEALEVTSQVLLEATVDAQGSNLSSTDVRYKVVAGPGSISENMLSFSGTGEVTVSAELSATETTNSVVGQSTVEVFDLHDVSGIALNENGDPFTSGLAIIADLNDVANTSAVTLDQDGAYSFEGLTDGDYELYVVPFTSDYILTFYGDVSPVLDPDAVPQVILLTNDFTGLTINMQLPPPPATEFLPEAEGGTISFLAQTGVGVGNRIVVGRVYDGDPLPNTLVILRTLDDEYVAADVTDETGLITFDGLPTAEYKLVLDIPGLGEVSAVVDVVEGESLDVTALIDEEGTSFEIATVLSTSLQQKETLLYPNPASTSFLLQSPEKILSVEVLDLAGKTVKRFNSREVYDVQGLLKGLYIIKVETKSGQVLKRLQLTD